MHAYTIKMGVLVFIQSASLCMSYMNKKVSKRLTLYKELFTFDNFFTE